MIVFYVFQFMFLHCGALLRNRFNILHLAFISNRPILLMGQQSKPFPVRWNLAKEAAFLAVMSLRVHQIESKGKGSTVITKCSGLWLWLPEGKRKRLVLLLSMLSLPVSSTGLIPNCLPNWKTFYTSPKLYVLTL